MVARCSLVLAGCLQQGAICINDGLWQRALFEKPIHGLIRPIVNNPRARDPTPGNVCNSAAVASLTFRTREPFVSSRSFLAVLEQYCTPNAIRRIAPARRNSTCPHLICGARS